MEGGGKRREKRRKIRVGIREYHLDDR